MKTNWKKRSETEIYIHIPFCVRKCQYCDFLSFAAPLETREQYVFMLCKEMEEWEKKEEVSVSTVFLGGGTPSLLTEKEIEAIFITLHDNYQFTENAEITIEANPGTVSESKLMLLRKCGVNRISFGLQSTQDEELKNLGRIHTFQEFLDSYEMARKAGFENINIDLMSALPGQSLASWQTTLRKVAELDPEHISAYCLIIEEGTPFYEKYREDEILREKGEKCIYLPDEETERRMYEVTREILGEYGYHRYEISNYAKQGKECRHNIGYWTRKEYKGFGLGAASLFREQRLKNTCDLKAYLNGKRVEETEELDKEEQIEETMFLGLRMMQGVSVSRFYEQYEIPMKEIYGEVIERMKDLGLLIEERDHIRLTEEGISLSNYVMSEFVL
ncbi:MAG: radical SAM family heme chaperone HemW [Muricoprocola sp.]